MTTMIHDLDLERRLQAERAACGADRYDEVWEGVYMMAPMPNDEHQMIVNALAAILQDLIGWPGLGQVRPGVNVSDRCEGWQQNYRVPDVAVFLNDTKAVNHTAFWLGGPDLAIEVVSPGDQTLEKLDFYARVNSGTAGRRPPSVAAATLSACQRGHAARGDSERRESNGSQLRNSSDRWDIDRRDRTAAHAHRPPRSRPRLDDLMASGRLAGPIRHGIDGPTSRPRSCFRRHAF